MNSSQKVVQSIHQPLNLQNWFILETPLHRSNNNSQSPTFQISSMQFDSDWEETLNDIDELIQSELRCTRPLYGETQPFGETRVEQLSAPRHVCMNDPSKKPSTDHEWSFTGKTFCKFHALNVIWQRPVCIGMQQWYNRRRITFAVKYKMQVRSDLRKKPRISVSVKQSIWRPILLSTVLWQSIRIEFASPHW